MNDWKDFFYLSIGERRALILLLILIAIGLILLIWGDILYDRQQAAAPVATERTEPRSTLARQIGPRTPRRRPTVVRGIRPTVARIAGRVWGSVSSA